MENNIFLTANGEKVENAIARFDWNRPGKPYDFFTGNNVRVNHTEKWIQVVATYKEKVFWIVVNIPHTYADGQYQIITAQEFADGVKGIVLGHVMTPEIFTPDHSGSISFNRNDKFTITFSGLKDQGYNILNGFIEFDDVAS
ncbi:hypothetical protein AQS70_13790 [Pseudomonas endophytica]|uniref:Uncharacterized protein n=1 Tax=Pseudomonas endophytica TaxID=1563157 RepID=A0A0N8VS79_9PSED|nr:hypothetical protein [Pseudomonas endophytica]KQB52572.1 hypothetical protein AQS70_13790 [Pseudomonas endophytica]